MSRIRASDGRLLETWNGAVNTFSLVAAMGRIFVAAQTASGDLYVIDPSQPPGDVAVVATDLGTLVNGMAFDGSRFWITHFTGTISIVTPGPTTPWAVIQVTPGLQYPSDVLFDGSHIWVADTLQDQGGAGVLVELDSMGNILMSVPVGNNPRHSTFDGANIWVPNLGSANVTVVHAATGTVNATLTTPEMTAPWIAAFDGTRVIVTDIETPGVAIWRAADLSPMGFVTTPPNPDGACSDGVNFWITLVTDHKLLRF